MIHTKHKRISCFLLSLLLACSILPVPKAAAAGALPFSDVSQSSWYYDSVRLACEKELVKGVTATRFQPDGTLTIAEAVTLAARPCSASKAFARGRSHSIQAANTAAAAKSAVFCHFRMIYTPLKSKSGVYSSFAEVRSWV